MFRRGPGRVGVGCGVWAAGDLGAARKDLWSFAASAAAWSAVWRAHSWVICLAAGLGVGADPHHRFTKACVWPDKGWLQVGAAASQLRHVGFLFLL